MGGFNFAPNGWAFCSGDTLPISQYETLFTLIGTTYGGDGINTFGIPNLQGRLPVHQGAGFVMGQSSGTESVTLTTAQIPAHTHGLAASTGAGNTQLPTGAVLASATRTTYAPATGTVAMAPQAMGNTGGSMPHENRHPFLCVSFIVSLFGIFPSQ